MLNAQLQVETVGGPDLVGPIVIGGAALLAAILAAYWQRAGLRHDRSLRDLEHAREVISTAVATIAEAIDGVSDLGHDTLSVDRAEQRVEDIKAKDDDADAKELRAALEIARDSIQRVRQTRETTAATLTRMRADTMRLRIAFGRDHFELLTQHVVLAASFQLWFSDLSPGMRTCSASGLQATKRSGVAESRHP